MSGAVQTATIDPAEVSIELFWAKVHKTDGCWLWTAGTFEAGYGAFAIKRKQRPAHRISYTLASGPIPEGLVIDHMCFVKLCVRPSHLRAITVKQNQENRSGLASNNMSGYTGVFQRGERWAARFTHNGQRIHLGTFTHVEAAARAVQEAKAKVFTPNPLKELTPTY